MQTHVVHTLKYPMRLQEYGVGNFVRLSTKSALKKALKKKLIFVDGVLGSTATFIRGVEPIEFHPPEMDKTKSARFVLKVKVVYEDHFLAIVYRSAGMLIPGNAFETIAKALSQNLQKSSAENATDPKPVHRLDYHTTGLLLVGKTAAVIVALNAQFKNGQIRKTYYAVAIGERRSKGIIDIPIDGKESFTTYKVLISIASARFGCLNLVQMTPKTGRRHQLRKHLCAIGNPILGDFLYGTEEVRLKGKGLYLHAQSLRFQHPFDDQELCISSELPKKFRTLFSSCHTFLYPLLFTV